MPTTTANLEQLVAQLDSIEKFQSSLWVKRPDGFQEVHLACRKGLEGRSIVHFQVQWSPGESFNIKNKQCCPGRQSGFAAWNAQFERDAKSLCPASVAEGMKQIVLLLEGSVPFIDSLVVKMSNEKVCLKHDLMGWPGQPLLKQDDELVRTVRLAWCEAFDIAQTVNKKPADPLKTRCRLMTEELKPLLFQGAPGITKLAGRTANELELLDFKAMDLSGATMEAVRLRGVGFSKATLTGANMQRSDVRNADFSGAILKEAKLAKADLTYAKASKADFTGAELPGAKLHGANLKDAVLKDADLTCATLDEADLRGVDLSKCKTLESASLSRAKYDETTTLPEDFAQHSQLLWKGTGSDPYKEKIKISAKATASVDFDGLMTHLKTSFDQARLKKALSMLKKESFQLFAEVQETSVIGVVKSQTDEELVYACMLTQDGEFCCCTQNLNPCGGLRGALCKHILLLVIGLSRTDQLAPSDVAKWILSSKVEKPKLREDEMSTTFLRYKSAEVGDIDWRPTETIPEDFYSF